MADLQKFQTELVSEHEKLTKAFEKAQVDAEKLWTNMEEAAFALEAFRTKYGKVLKALADGAVKVEG